MDTVTLYAEYQSFMYVKNFVKFATKIYQDCGSVDKRCVGVWGCRLLLLPSVSDLLKQARVVGQAWVQAGRPCSPRVLFVFESNTPDESDPISEQAGDQLETNVSGCPMLLVTILGYLTFIQLFYLLLN